MAKEPVHITPRGGEGWAVIREGNDRASSIFPTRARLSRPGGRSPAATIPSC